MAGHDSEALDTARTALGKAVRDFVEIMSSERGHDNSYVYGWAAYAEYTTTEMQKDEMSGNVVIVPDDQTASASRGLFEFGADAFRRSM